MQIEPRDDYPISFTCFTHKFMLNCSQVSTIINNFTPYNIIQSYWQPMYVVLLALTLTLLPTAAAQNTPCYVTCKENSCSPQNPLVCLACDPGTTLLANTCLPVGGQSVLMS